MTRGAAAAVATNINMDGGDGDDLIELASGTVTFSLCERHFRGSGWIGYRSRLRGPRPSGNSLP